MFRNQKSEIRNQKSEIRCRKSEIEILISDFRFLISDFKKNVFILILIFFPLSLSAQTSEEMDVYVQPFDPFAFTPDTTEIHNQIFHATTETIITTDTIIWASDDLSEELDIAEATAFSPNPDRSLWLGAVIPGFGQIANRQYWKLPFVYTGFVVGGFAITWYSNEYNFFRIAHRDILDPDPTRNSYAEFMIVRGASPNDAHARTQYERIFQSARDNNRRLRDWAILISILYYGAVMLEAYVTAQLFDFDISPDLSLNIQPAIINNDFAPSVLVNEYDIFSQQTRMLGNTNAFGLQWSIRF